MTIHTTGTFDVTTEDQPYDEADGARLVRSTVSKTFHGGLEGTSQVHLLKVFAQVEGSAGYVGVERVTGTVSGRSGTFVLQHAAVSNRGRGTTTVQIVPDTGTGELLGINGSMTITRVDGAHHYAFDCTLTPSR